MAAVSVDGGLRRQIRVDLSREKITALNLSVDRVVQILRTENQNIPLGEVFEADRMYLLRSPGQFTDIDEIRNLVVMTKDGVPIYLRDIADVRDTTEDRRSFTRINGNPGIRMRVTKQSGTNTVQIAEGVRAEIERINREVPGVSLTVLDDQSRYIQRSIGSVQEHALLGSLLVIVVIFAFLRDMPLHHHHLHVDSDLGHRHLRAALLRRLHPEHADLRRPGAGHRHDRRRRHRRAREHLSPPRDGQGPHDRRHRRAPRKCGAPSWPRP